MGHGRGALWDLQYRSVDHASSVAISENEMILIKSSQRFNSSVQHELNIDFGKLTSLIDYRIVIMTTVR